MRDSLPSIWVAPMRARSWRRRAGRGPCTARSTTSKTPELSSRLSGPDTRSRRHRDTGSDGRAGVGPYIGARSVLRDDGAPLIAGLLLRGRRLLRRALAAAELAVQERQRGLGHPRRRE